MIEAASVRERRYAFNTLDAAALAEMMRPVLGSRRIVSAVPLTAGHVNTNYAVRAEELDQAFVLRLYAPRDPDACAREVALLRRVKDRVPVPDVLWADPTGATHGCPVAITTLVAGTLLQDVIARGDDEEVIQSARSVGAALAAIGSFHFERAGFLGPDLSVTGPISYRIYIEECLRQEIVRERLGEPLAERTQSLVAKNATRLDAAIQNARSLVHADYKAANLLIGPGGTVSGVLDWEFAHAATPLLDLAILLRERDALPDAFTNEVARGFTEAGGALPEDWRRVTRLLDLVNLCDFLAQPGDRSATTASVRAAIEITVNTLNDLGDRRDPADIR